MTDKNGEEEKELQELIRKVDKVKRHLVIDKCLWVGNYHVHIDHVGYDLDKPLNYIEAFRKMAKKLKV